MELLEKDCLSKEDFKKAELVQSFCHKINKALSKNTYVVNEDLSQLKGEYGFSSTAHVGFGVTYKAGYQHLFGEEVVQPTKTPLIKKFTIRESIEAINKYFSQFKTFDASHLKSL